MNNTENFIGMMDHLGFKRIVRFVDLKVQELRKEDFRNGSYIRTETSEEQIKINVLSKAGVLEHSATFTPDMPSELSVGFVKSLVKVLTKKY